MFDKLKRMLFNKQDEECTCEFHDEDQQKPTFDDLIESAGQDNTNNSTKILAKIALLTRELTENNKDITQIAAEELKDLIVCCASASKDEMFVLIRNLGHRLHKAEKNNDEPTRNTVEILGDWITSTHALFNPQGKKFNGK